LICFFFVEKIYLYCIYLTELFVSLLNFSCCVSCTALGALPELPCIYLDYAIIVWLIVFFALCVIMQNADVSVSKKQKRDGKDVLPLAVMMRKEGSIQC
jgi:hypothetical protein